MLLTGVLVILGLLTAWFAFLFIKDVIKTKKENKLENGNFYSLGAIGFVANFFDTLGIGSFAPTTAMLKQFKLSSDRTLPGTLNVSMTIPVVLEAFIFIKGIEVEPITLVAMIASATLGAIIGAGFVSKLDERKVQYGMAMALIVVGIVMLMGQLELMPVGGEAVGLTGVKFVIGIVGNFILGALMTLGIGLYAPCMALIYALGMSPAVAFPIMMGSCAFLMPAASSKFVKANAYDKKASIAITLFGIVGVLIAAYIVKSLPLNILKWLVIVVIAYTSAMMYRSAKKNTNQANISKEA